MMDYMDSGLRYTPKSDKDWDTSVQFLPASDNKKLEKKKGPGKVGAVVGVVIFATVVALMTGLLVWHFHFRKDVWVKRMYSSSMRITNQVFEESYLNSNSSEFKALAKKVTSQLKTIYTKNPKLAKYYVGSTVQAFSEGSVVVYYLSEFKVPAGQEAAVDSAMSQVEKLVDAAQNTRSRPGNALFLTDVVSSVLDYRLVRFSVNRTYEYFTRPNYVGQIQSPGFPNRPYTPNTFIKWYIRADPNNVIKLEFDTMNLEENCKNDFVKIYDSLLTIEDKVIEEMCGYYSPSEPLTFLSSNNVMLVTMATNENKNYPGFRASFSQVRRGGKEMACGGNLSGLKGNFTTPNYPNYYPTKIDCQWTIQVPAGKAVKVTFRRFLVSGPGQEKQNCPKDYVRINNKKLCGEQPDGTVIEISQSNTMNVEFHSDDSYVDRGFSAEYEAIDTKNPCPNQFQCKNEMCIKMTLRCDGWNDCGDMSDELNCKCKKTDIHCDNGLCKSPFWKCDDVNDCGDGTDERNCGTCQAGHLKCKNDKCVSEKKRCDGTNDCGDGTDELDCVRGSSVGAQNLCTDLTYKCKNGKCISKVNPECDGTNDCEDNSDEANCDCGKSAFKSARIVGGQEATQGEFPWQVSLHAGSTHLCGASLISPRWLVTAAHCVQDHGKTKYSQPGTWEAYLGLHHQQQKITGKNVVKKNLKQIICHPNYNSFTFDNDIALMELDSPVTYSDYIKPICLPAPQHDFPVGREVFVTGWGATREGGSAAASLQKAKVRIINHGTCDSLMGGQLTSRMMCAGVLAGGVDACQGDSGGPLSSFSTANRAFLAGVVSWGDGCARRNKPGIYTTVTKFRGWIKEKTGV